MKKLSDVKTRKDFEAWLEYSQREFEKRTGMKCSTTEEKQRAIDKMSPEQKALYMKVKSILSGNSKIL